MRSRLFPLSMLLLAGCTAQRPAPTTGSATRPHTLARQPREPFSNPNRVMSLGSMARAVQVDVYQLTVPYSTISRNEKFWKRIDETCVDVATSDVLFKNGIRVGL